MKPNALRWMLAVAMLVPASAWAGSDDDDGPGRGVARLSVINGDVSVRRGDSGDVVAAAINAPLVAEDRVYTGQASRAELQFDYSNMLRLSSDSEVRLSQLEYHRYTIQLARGLVTFRVLRDGEPADVEVDTPSVSVRPVKRGTYRIMVSDDGTTEVTVRAGEADIFTPRGSERLSAGRTMLVRGDPSNPEFQMVAEVGRDNWDRWNDDRDRDLERAQVAYQYVSRDIYGAEDLNGHGRWISDPEYGWVWAPYVAPDWVPYRYGRWAWVDWYGWTWVSYDPWGWAPYHYGRWYNRVGYGWCWYPGGFAARHYWRPALVAFFGFGNAGVGLGWGNVGWIPLAPREPFHAWYGRGYYGGYRNGTYINNSVRIVNNVNITNVYRNARVTNAITGVEAGNFGRGRSGTFMRVSNDQVGRASLARGPVPVAPGRESLRLADREAPRSIRTSNEGARFFTARRTSAREERVPFEQQRMAVEQASRRALGAEPARAPQAARAAESPSTRGVAGGRTADGWRRVDSPARTGAPATDTTRTEGWRRTGSEARPDALVNRGVDSRTSEPSRNNSWRRFGDPGASRTVEPGVTRGGGRVDVVPGRSQQRTEPRNQPRSEPRSEPRTERQDNSWRRDWGSVRTESAPARDSSPRAERFGSSGTARGESLRVNPPIVRERAAEAPRYEAPRQAAPRVEAPRQSAPAPRMEAPRMESRGPSGGGGGIRAGGGGGGRASGGGGVSSHGGGSRGGGGNRGR